MAELTVSMGVSDRTDTQTVAELESTYAQFCSMHDFHPVPPSAFEKELPSLMEEIHGYAKSHNIRRDGSEHRGYHGVRVEVTRES